MKRGSCLWRYYCHQSWSAFDGVNTVNTDDECCTLCTNIYASLDVMVFRILRTAESPALVQRIYSLIFTDWSDNRTNSIDLVFSCFLSYVECFMQKNQHISTWGSVIISVVDQHFKIIKIFIIWAENNDSLFLKFCLCCTTNDHFVLLGWSNWYNRSDIIFNVVLYSYRIFP